MNIFKKVDRLQKENEKLKKENKELSNQNKELLADMERSNFSTDATVKKAQATMQECEKLRATYEESINSAKEAQKQFYDLYNELQKTKKQLNDEISKVKP